MRGRGDWFVAACAVLGLVDSLLFGVGMCLCVGLWLACFCLCEFGWLCFSCAGV